MEKATGVTRRAKIEVITISDDDSDSGLPIDRVKQPEKMIEGDNEPITSIPLPPAPEIAKAVHSIPVPSIPLPLPPPAEIVQAVQSMVTDMNQSDASSQEVVNGLQMRLTEVSAQLADAKRKEEEAIVKNVGLTLENVSLKKELDEAKREAGTARNRVVEQTAAHEEFMNNFVRPLQHQWEEKFMIQAACKDTQQAHLVFMDLGKRLSEAKEHATYMRIREEMVTAELEQARRTMEQMRNSRNELEESARYQLHQQDMELRCAQEEIVMQSARINVLVGRLAQYEGWHEWAGWRTQPMQLMQLQLQEPLQQQPQQMIKSEEPDSEPVLEKEYLFMIGDPIDIFQLCLPDGPESISLDDAVEKIRSQFNECGSEKWKKYNSEGKCDVTLTCRACKEDIGKHIIAHFLSEKHTEKVRARGAAVSQPAVQHWLQQLQLASGTAARPVQQVAAAAAAATPQQQIKQEEPVIVKDEPIDMDFTEN